MQVQSLGFELYEEDVSEAAIASLNLTSATVGLEKLSGKLQAEVTITDIFAYALSGPSELQKELLLSRWSGELLDRLQRDRFGKLSTPTD